MHCRASSSSWRRGCTTRRGWAAARWSRPSSGRSADGRRPPTHGKGASLQATDPPQRLLSVTQRCVWGEDPLDLQLRDFSQEWEHIYLWFCWWNWDSSLQPWPKCLMPQPSAKTGMSTRTCSTYLKSLFCLEEFVPCLLSIPWRQIGCPVSAEGPAHSGCRKRFPCTVSATRNVPVTAREDICFLLSRWELQDPGTGFSKLQTNRSVP